MRTSLFLLFTIQFYNIVTYLLRNVNVSSILNHWVIQSWISSFTILNRLNFCERLFDQLTIKKEKTFVSKVEMQQRSNVDETSTKSIHDLSIENNDDENTNEFANVDVRDKQFVESSFASRSKNVDEKLSMRRDSNSILKKSSFIDNNKNYATLLEIERAKRKRALDKRAYKIAKLKIIQTIEKLKELIRLENFLIVNDSFSRRRFRAHITKSQTMKNDERSILKRSRFTKKLKNLNVYKSKNIREFQNWMRNAKNALKFNSNYFERLDNLIKWIQQFLNKDSTILWFEHKKKNKHNFDLFKFDYFVDYLQFKIENSKTRKLNVDKEHKKVKQRSKQNVKTFIVYLKNLEKNLDFNEINKRDALLFDFKEEIQNMIKLTNVLKTIVDVLNVVIRAKRSSLLFFFAINVRQQQNTQDNHKSQNDQEKSHQERERKQNDNKSIDDNRQFDDKSFENDRRKDIVHEERRDSKKNKFCYKCDKIEHIVKNCFDLEKEKKLTKMNVVRKNEIDSSKFNRQREIVENSFDSKN